MPKLFAITIGVEESALGTVLHKLHSMPGVAKVDIDMGTAKKTNGKGVYDRAVGYDRAGPNVSSLVRDMMLRSKRPLKTAEIIDELNEKAGLRSRTSVYTAVHGMRENGWLNGDAKKGYVLNARGRAGAKQMNGD